MQTTQSVASMSQLIGQICHLLKSQPFITTQNGKTYLDKILSLQIFEGQDGEYNIFDVLFVQKTKAFDHFPFECGWSLNINPHISITNHKLHDKLFRLIHMYYYNIPQCGSVTSLVEDIMNPQRMSSRQISKYHKPEEVYCDYNEEINFVDVLA